MNQQSIFEGVVKGEDSHTNLLRNLMKADETYCIAICDLLRPKELSLQLTPPPDVQTQVPLKTPNSNHGRADMLIEADHAVLLVEVKTAVGCALTRNQAFETDDSGEPMPTGYLKYLEYRKQQGDRIGLCLLVPRSWKLRGTEDAKLRQLQRLLPTKLMTWEDVCTRTGSQPGEFGELVRHFGTFLEGDFMEISFGPEEASLLTSDHWLTAFGSASIKLHELVNQAAKHLKDDLDNGTDLRFQVWDPWGNATEYGAMVHRRGGEPVLWFGILAEANWPLVVGFDEKWIQEEQQLDLRGLSETNAPEGWKAFRLLEECFTGPQPLRKLVQAVVSILRARPS